MIKVTVFKNLYDNKTDKNLEFDTYDGFKNFIHKASLIRYMDKGEASLITPASFKPDTTRANKSVVQWSGWCAVDVDEHVFAGDLKSELKALYGQYEYICYSTASSTNEHPKFRLVFPLSSDVKADDIKHFWFALNKELDDLGDPQTKDLSRMYFVPGTYEGANNFIFDNSGKTMDPYEVMSRYDYVAKSSGNSFLDSLPESVKEQVLSHRKNQMTNISISWNTFHDCPFVNKSLVAEYNTINDTGWYRKMYQIMVSIAMRAINNKYPISSQEIANMCTQIDNENGGWYGNRPLVREAEGAINFAYEHVDINR